MNTFLNCVMLLATLTLSVVLGQIVEAINHEADVIQTKEMFCFTHP